MFLNLVQIMNIHTIFCFIFLGFAPPPKLQCQTKSFFFPVVGRGLNLGVHSSSDSLPYNLVPVLGLFTMNKLKNGVFFYKSKQNKTVLHSYIEK